MYFSHPDDEGSKFLRDVSYEATLHHSGSMPGAGNQSAEGPTCAICDADTVRWVCGHRGAKVGCVSNCMLTILPPAT
jgi:hypothetical protein